MIWALLEEEKGRRGRPFAYPHGERKNLKKSGHANIQKGGKKYGVAVSTFKGWMQSCARAFPSKKRSARLNQAVLSSQQAGEGKGGGGTPFWGDGQGKGSFPGGKGGVASA